MKGRIFLALLFGLCLSKASVTATGSGSIMPFNLNITDEMSRDSYTTSKTTYSDQSTSVTTATTATTNIPPTDTATATVTISESGKSTTPSATVTNGGSSPVTTLSTSVTNSGSVESTTLSTIVTNNGSSETTTPSATVTISGSSPSTTLSTIETSSGLSESTTPSATVTNSGSSPSIIPSNTVTNSASDDSCSTSPCVTEAATCTNIQDGHICQCPYGLYYEKDLKICSEGRQFFGTVELTTAYSPDFENTSSSAYGNLYDTVQKFFKACFEHQTEYAETIITKISRSTKSSYRFWNVQPASSTQIEVINIFKQSSNITQDDINKAVNITLQNDKTVSSFTKSSPCNSSYCDEATTVCILTQNDMLPVCKCKDGLSPTPQAIITACTGCAPDCTEAHFKECIQVEVAKGSVPTCQCRADYQFDKENKTCTSCDFGYSGKGCKDNILLILVIVGAVGGALVLALLGGVIGLSVKSSRSKKTPERERLIDHEENPVFGSGTSTNGNLFPKVRVKPTVNTNVATTNPYTTEEPFQRTVPTRDYDDDNDSWFEMSRKDNRYGIQSKQ